MTLPSPLCLLRGLWGLRSYLSPTAWARARRGSRTALAPISGHVLQDTEVHVGCTVYVSRCVDCGAQSLSWNHGEPIAAGPRELPGECYCHPRATA